MANHHEAAEAGRGARKAQSSSLRTHAVVDDQVALLDVDLQAETGSDDDAGARRATFVMHAEALFPCACPRAVTAVAGALSSAVILSRSGSADLSESRGEAPRR